MTVDSGGPGLTDRPPPPRRRSAPPFRRRSPAGLPVSPVPPRGLEGLVAGGTAEALTGPDRGRRLRVAAASTGIHLLLLVGMLGGLVPVASEDSVPAVLAEDEEEERPLLTFEAPPVEEEEAPPPALVVEAEPVPPPVERPEPAVPLQIPEAQLAVPSTGFQNDLPFSDGQDEEFFFDQPMGDDPDREPSPEPTSEPTPPPEAEPDLAVPSPATSSRLHFDPDAFRDRLADPAGDARRRADEAERAAARARAEEADRRRGTPTDIWRFLEGKRFRNPEGGLVSNRNNTLYYDDRGADMVPWIGRLIAEVRRNWYVPYAAAFQAGHVAIAISVTRSGAIEWLQMVIPSGTAGFDNAAVGALRGAELLPLPDDYPGRNFEIMLVFWYNEQPYDLFGGAAP